MGHLILMKALSPSLPKTIFSLQRLQGFTPSISTLRARHYSSNIEYKPIRSVLVANRGKWEILLIENRKGSLGLDFN
jgi:hypothetical protein